MELKGNPVMIKYSSSKRLKKVYKFRMIRRAIYKSNITAK